MKGKRFADEQITYALRQAESCVLGNSATHTARVDHGHKEIRGQTR
jgi:hypothetical protein